VADEALPEAQPEHPLPDRPLPPPTWRDVLDRFVPPDGARVLRWAGAAAAVVLLAGAGWWALRPASGPPVEASLPYAPAAVASSSTSTTVGELLVHAAGAVASPGVHAVPLGSRVADLLAAAGGATPDADVDRVNLAAPLADGQRVWFPRVGEAPPPDAAPAEGGSPESAGPLDLNTATVEQLEALPGVGPSIAAAIVEHRDRNGPFRSVDGLLDVAGIGPSRLEELRDLVTV
jgi:competence protein ComEA